MTLPCPSLWRVGGLLILAGTLAFPACGRLSAQNDDSDARRLAEQLRVRPGMHLAEIGAGSGALTVALAKDVGVTGLVYSNELSGNRRAAIRRAVEREGLTNVTIVEGRPTDTNLPDACCEGIFMRDVYHHFGDPALMNLSLWRSLKPGGRLAIIDFPPRGGREADEPEGRDSGTRHGVSPGTVQQELRAAGFEIIETDAPTGRRGFMVVGQKR